MGSRERGKFALYAINFAICEFSKNQWFPFPPLDLILYWFDALKFMELHFSEFFSFMFGR